MTKHRTSRRRRSQKGGGLFDWFGSSTPVDPNAVEQGWVSWLSGKTSNATTKASGALTDVTGVVTGKVSEFGTGIGSILNYDVKSTGPTEAPYVATGAPIEATGAPIEATGATVYQTSNYPAGGRRKRKMKGGKGGLGLTPVSGLNVAKPTYLIGPNTNQSIKGGSRRRQRKSKKSRKSKKTRRH